MKTNTIIRNIMFLSKNCEKSAEFFIDVIGLKVNHCSPEYAELMDKHNNRIVFKHTQSEAYTKIGYSPIITFNVDSYDLVMEKMKNYNVELDGDPVDSEIGKLACLKTPDGLMIGIFESKDNQLDDDNFNVDFNSDANLDAVSKEVKGIFDKFKL